MKVVIYSNSKLIYNILLKEKELPFDYSVEKDFSKLKDLLFSEDIILLYHLNGENEKEAVEIMTLNPKQKAIVLSNTPTNKEGCKYLKLGYKSYLHSLSNIEILKSAISSISAGNVYVYPELMNFLIGQLEYIKEDAIDLDKVGANEEDSPKPNFDLLTQREYSVLALLSKGMTNSNIADNLDLAEITVKKHIGSMFEKLHVRDRLSLALMYKSKDY
jgi:DNA-binding NarL/FixJ family response regulator